MKSYTNPVYAYRRSPDQDTDTAHHPVIVVGAGPVGLSAAIDLTQRGLPVVVLDDDKTVSLGSRAICYAKRTLEIFDRLGCGQKLVDKGVHWKVGKVFHKDQLVYTFDLLPEPGHRRPAFINLQQYHLEECLVVRLQQLPEADLRWLNKVVEVERHAGGALLTVATPEGQYRLSCDWLIVADGAKSPIRAMLGIEFEGQVFHDRFLIVDVRMHADLPIERKFWFDPPFHPNQSALMHAQADDVWRIDFQLGPDVDPEQERTPERIEPRLRALLGHDAQFDIEWASVYTFQCRRMRHFRHGPILFAGDAAHLVSPFGARGANGGVQDVDNLIWKLHLVIKNLAPATLLDTYDRERTQAADENMRCSMRSTDFITPKSGASRLFRDATLSLAKRYAFARRMVNSGRLSVPAVLHDSPLNTADRDGFASAIVVGSPASDAPVAGPRRWFLEWLTGDFTLVVFADDHSLEGQAIAYDGIRCATVTVDAGAEATRTHTAHLGDAEGLLAQRYDARPGTCYLFRPDQHVCARWRAFDAALVRAAMARACGNE